MAKGTLNKVLLIGRLGQDPEMRTTQSGQSVASFSIATNESWRNKEGEQQERTDWHNCVAFGATAEKYIGPYVKKGTLVSIEGTLQTRSWEDKDGNKRYTTEVVANPFGGVQILNSGDGGGNYDSSAGMDQTPKSSEENTSQVTEDDLPF
tara:strand:- start:818 stop:1267 length:450 start_codon:yes stop_codon:yes gene_type:complete